MDKQDYIDRINALWAEYRATQRRLQEITEEREAVAKAYAEEHLPETGLTPGQKVTVKNVYTGKEETAWFAGAEPFTVHPDGNLLLRFYPAKKDGTPSKRIDHSLTQTFIVGKAAE